MIEYYRHHRQFHLSILQLLRFEQQSYSILIYQQLVMNYQWQMQLYNQMMHHRSYHLDLKYLKNQMYQMNQMNQMNLKFLSYLKSQKNQMNLMCQMNLKNQMNLKFQMNLKNQMFQMNQSYLKFLMSHLNQMNQKNQKFRLNHLSVPSHYHSIDGLDRQQYNLIGQQTHQYLDLRHFLQI